MLQVVDVSQVCETLPFSPISPVDRTGLYAALKQTQRISMNVSPNKATIVTLDLQLYAKCMELCCRNEIKDNLIFRLGILHIVFAFLKVLGKYMNCSGLDQILVDTETYSSTTLSQIFE